jgi:hypothetical protein
LAILFVVVYHSAERELTELRAEVKRMETLVAIGFPVSMPDVRLPEHHRSCGNITVEYPDYREMNP